MSNKSKKILSEISAGELLDKISILEIKIKMVKSKSGLKEIKKEYKILRKIQKSSITMKNRVKNLFNSLKNVNLIFEFFVFFKDSYSLLISRRLFLSLILASFISKMAILSNNSAADISVSIFLDLFDICMLN